MQHTLKGSMARIMCAAEGKQCSERAQQQQQQQVLHPKEQGSEWQ